MPEIYYTDYGNGLPVVLIHGFCETHAVWNNLSGKLSGSWRILCPDLPGFGNSPLSANPDFSLNFIAETLNNWLDETGIEKCVMIGHSLGGYVSLAFAERYAEKLTGLGLFHSTSLADTEEKKKTRNKVIDYIQEKGTRNFVKTFIPGLFYHKTVSIEQDIDRLVDEALACTPQSLIAYTKAMRDRPDRQHILEQLPFPVLFITGDKDSVIPVEHLKAQMAGLDQRAVFILPETGHMGMFEREKETTQIVQDYVNLIATPQ